MPFIDTQAAARLVELREARGLSPEDLAREIAEMAKRLGPGWTRGAVDPYTIRRIEKKGFVPGTRVSFVIATYFEVDRREIWKPGQRVEIAA